MNPHRPEPGDELPPSEKSPQPPHPQARDEETSSDADNAQDRDESDSASGDESPDVKSPDVGADADSPAVDRDDDSQELAAASTMPLSDAADVDAAERPAEMHADDESILDGPSELSSDTASAHAGDAFVDEPPETASIAEIIKPADEWWWGNPSWASRSVASEVGLDSPSGAVGEPLASDASPKPTPPNRGPVRDLVDRHDEPAIIERLPYAPSEDSPGEHITLMASPKALNPPVAVGKVDSSPASSTEEPQRPASLPLALPVMVRATEPLVQQVLDASREMFIQVADERAEWKINEHEHWKACELRAINGPGW